MMSLKNRFGALMLAMLALSGSAFAGGPPEQQKAVEEVSARRGADGEVEQWANTRVDDLFLDFCDSVGERDESEFEDAFAEFCDFPPWAWADPQVTDDDRSFLSRFESYCQQLLVFKHPHRAAAFWTALSEKTKLRKPGLET